ncbi:oxidoreductase, partial [Pseudomonas monteilii]|nr:oxidoreductase [Pseudomonas monteilii]
QLALLGGGMEVLGITLREGFKHASAPGFASVLKTGLSLVTAGATISAAAGLYDAIQAGFSVKRTFLAGDIKASRWNLLAGTGFLIGIYFSIKSISAPLLMGPLGLAIVLGAAAYSAIQRANKNESKHLERWARRCYFGKANETPFVHWNTSEHADIAFAELNAATLGLEAFIGFETHRSDPMKTGKIGGLVNLALDQKIRFSITLPTFDEHRSGYRWYVIVHRHGDGRGYSYRAGEVVASEEFQVPPEYIEHSCTAEFKPSRPQKHIDYKQDKTTIEIIDRAIKLEKGGELRHRHFFGAIELIPDIGAHSIIAATLSIAFWPDRNTPAAYAKMTTLELNE